MAEAANLSDQHRNDPQAQPEPSTRGWDAADELLLRQVTRSGHDDDGNDDGPAGTDEANPDEAGTRAANPVAPGDPLHGLTIAVMGDRWGAITTALAARPGDKTLVQISESFLCQRATRTNLARAGVNPDAVTMLTTQDAPPDRVDVLLIRTPKSLSLLEDQLHRIAGVTHRDTVVVGAGMTKEIHRTTLATFERVLGPTRTSLAHRKARLIFCTPEPGLARDDNPWPLTYRLPPDIGAMSGRAVVNHGGVFCADRLDIGTRLLLRHLPNGLGQAHVIDLGCGNGVIGTALAVTNPQATVTFVDESYPALASAAATYAANGGDATRAAFRAADCLVGFPAASSDLIVCNPPFHSHQATTDETAWRMFVGARSALRPGGELLVIGNRHLGYHVKLRRLFGHCAVVASDPKFVILRAVKR